MKFVSSSSPTSCQCPCHCPWGIPFPSRPHPLHQVPTWALCPSDHPPLSPRCLLMSPYLLFTPLVLTVVFHGAFLPPPPPLWGLRTISETFVLVMPGEGSCIYWAEVGNECSSMSPPHTHTGRPHNKELPSQPRGSTVLRSETLLVPHLIPLGFVPFFPW